MNWELRLGDSLDLMRAMPDESVFSIVTSCEYADQRSYAGGNEARTTARNGGRREPGGRNSSRKQRSEAPMKFAIGFRPFLHEMLRVVGPQGSLMLNIGVVQRDGEESPYADDILGYARSIVGRPVSRVRQEDPYVAELTRCCTDGTFNAPSKLYATCARAAKALGYRQLITYTRADEPGTSLKAAGWRVIGRVRAKTWHTPSRPRDDQDERVERLVWEAP